MSESPASEPTPLIPSEARFEVLSRREFALGLGTGLALSSGMTSPEAIAQEAATKPADKKPPKKPSPEEPAVSPAELVVDLIRQHYPHPQLTGAALDEVRSDVMGNLFRSRALSDFPLRNSDEPGFVFAAYRRD